MGGLCPLRGPLGGMGTEGVRRALGADPFIGATRYCGARSKLISVCLARHVPVIEVGDVGGRSCCVSSRCRMVPGAGCADSVVVTANGVGG